MTLLKQFPLAFLMTEIFGIFMEAEKRSKKRFLLELCLLFQPPEAKVLMDLTNEENLLKWPASGDIIRPRFSILNPEFTCTLGAYQTACGITDIMVHVMERYFTNTKHVETTDRICEALLTAVLEEAPKVMKNLQDYEARANIMGQECWPITTLQA